MALPPGSCDSVLGLCVWCGWGMIVKLPFWACLVAGWLVRPIFENSTACTCHMPNNLGHFFLWFEIPLDQFWIVSDGIRLVMIELVACVVLFRPACGFRFLRRV